MINSSTIITIITDRPCRYLEECCSQYKSQVEGLQSRVQPWEIIVMHGQGSYRQKGVQNWSSWKIVWFGSLSPGSWISALQFGTLFRDRQCFLCVQKFVLCMIMITRSLLVVVISSLPTMFRAYCHGCPLSCDLITLIIIWHWHNIKISYR